MRQEVQKTVRDMQYEQVQARRYECLSCHRTMRVYPKGVLGGQFSQRIKGIGVMLYLLGLSYGAVELMLAALGVWMSKACFNKCARAMSSAIRKL
jgi:transposase-like protein